MKANALITFYVLLITLTGYAQNPTNKIIARADSFFQAQKWQMAKELYESVLTDTITNPLAWNKLGFSNYNVKKYDDAMKCFKKSLSQNPPPPLSGIIYSRTARILAIKNEKQKTFIALDSAVSNGYSFIKELDTLPEYSALRDDTYFKHLREQVYINGNPCMADAHRREFDFWVGEWEVFPTGAKPNGPGAKSVIQIISGGCAILENWESPNSNGKSINFIDPATNKWKQSWAGNYVNGTQEFVDGEYKDNAMRFTFETKNAQGNKIIGHFIFYNEGPSQVRQFNETSSDGGKTWTTSYDFTYYRRK